VRLPRVTLSLLVAGGAVTMVGALFAAPRFLGMGGVVVFVLLALHPVLTRPVLPARLRHLVRAGLLGLLLSLLLQVQSLAVSLERVHPVTVAEMLAFGSDPQRLRAQALLTAASASLQVLACGAFASALALVPPPRPRAAVTGCGVLTVIAVTSAVFATVNWVTTPEPAVVLPPGIDPELGGDTVVLTSVMVAGDPLLAVLVGLLLFASFLMVDGLSRSRITPAGAP
jgi:hypothetical protein